MKIKCDYFNSDFHAYNSIIDDLLLINYNISNLYCNLKTNNTFLIYCPCFWELLFLSQFFDFELSVRIVCYTPFYVKHIKHLY